MEQAFEDILERHNEDDEPYAFDRSVAPSKLREPEELEYELMVHKVGQAVVLYNRKAIGSENV